MNEEPTPDATLGPSKKPYAKPQLIEQRFVTIKRAAC